MECASTTHEGFYIVSGLQEVSQNTPFQARPLRRSWLWLKLWQCAALLNILWMETALYKFQLLLFIKLSNISHNNIATADKSIVTTSKRKPDWHFTDSVIVNGSLRNISIIHLHIAHECIVCFWGTFISQPEQYSQHVLLFCSAIDSNW